MRGLIVGGVVGAIVLLGLAPAAAAPGAKAGTWASFTPTSATLAPGFPDAVITSAAGVSVSSTETVVGATPPGLVYGTSNGRTYLSLATSTTTPVNSVTLTFAAPTPASAWSVVLGDVDAEDVTISGTAAGGAPLTAADLGLVEPYTTTASAPPTWDAGTLTLVGEGSDTDGAAAWFSPAVAVTSLTFTSTRRSGSPAAYVWLVGLTASLAGQVTDAAGTPVAGATVELRAPGGGALPGATPLTAGADGTFEFPAVMPVPVELVATAPGGSPGAAVAVTPVAGAFPDLVALVAEPVAVTPTAPTLPATGTAPSPALLPALAVLGLGTALVLGGARPGARIRVDRASCAR